MTLLLLEKVVRDAPTLTFVIGAILPNTYTTTFIILFCLLLLMVLRRFNTINDCIKDNFKTEEEEPIKVWNKKHFGAEKLIMKLADIHDCLNDVVTILNECFAFIVSEDSR